MQAISQTLRGAGQGLIKDRLYCGSVLQVGLGIRMGLISGFFPSVSASMESYGRKDSRFEWRNHGELVLILPIKYNVTSSGTQEGGGRKGGGY